MPLDGPRARALADRLRAAGIAEDDLHESFVHSGGKGGQNVNKVATCVVLVHRPTATTVKCQRFRTQAANRFAARELLVAKIEEARKTAERTRAAELARTRRQKRRRPRRAQLHMLAQKHARGDLKAARRRVRGDED